MNFKRGVHAAIRGAGWYVKKLENVPTGIDWAHDLDRMVPGFRPEMIFDVGANIGQTTLWLRGKYPSAQIHAFEPMKATYERLLQATKGLRGVECHQLALGDTEVTVEVAAVANDPRNSLATGVFDDHPDAEANSVRVETLDGFCHRHRIARLDNLKIDTEGYELAVLDGASRMLAERRISTILCEVTFDRENRLQSDFEAVRGLLAASSFRTVGFYDVETLFRSSPFGSFCNALFVREDLLPTAT